MSLSSAVKIGTTRERRYTDQNLPPYLSLYYWIRFESKDGILGSYSRREWVSIF